MKKLKALALSTLIILFSGEYAKASFKFDTENFANLAFLWYLDSHCNILPKADRTELDWHIDKIVRHSKKEHSKTHNKVLAIIKKTDLEVKNSSCEKLKTAKGKKIKNMVLTKTLPTARSYNKQMTGSIYKGSKDGFKLHYDMFASAEIGVKIGIECKFMLKEMQDEVILVSKNVLNELAKRYKPQISKLNNVLGASYKIAKKTNCKKPNSRKLYVNGFKTLKTLERALGLTKTN